MTAFLDLKAQIKAQVDVIPDDKLEDVLAYLKQFEVKKKSQNVMKYAGAWDDMSEEDFQQYLKAAKRSGEEAYEREMKKKSEHIMKYVEAWNEMSEEDFEKYLKAYRNDMSEKETWRDMAKDDFEACMRVAKDSGVKNYKEFKKKVGIEHILSFAGICEDLDDEFFDDLTVNLHENRLKETSEPIEF